jgi:hypothetical protein
LTENRYVQVHELPPFGWGDRVERDPGSLEYFGVQSPRTGADSRAYNTDDTHGYGDTNAYIHADRHTDGHIHPYGHNNSHTNDDPHPYTHRNTDKDANAIPYADIDPAPAFHLDAHSCVRGSHCHARTGGESTACPGYATRERPTRGQHHL